MAHIVFIINDLVSVRNAIIDLSKRLQQANHRITIASPKPQGKAIRAYNMAYVQLDAPSTITETRSHWQKWRDMRQRRDAGVAALKMDAMVATIEDLHADLLVIEAELPEHIIALTTLKIPIATCAYFPSVYKRRNIPPLHDDIIPNKGWRGSSIGIEVAWWRYQLRLLRGEIRHFLSNGGLYRLSILRHLAQKVGFDLRRNASAYHWINPILVTNFPLLYLNAIEFDFPHHPPKNVYHLGALLNQERIEAVHETDGQRLMQLLAKIADDPNQRVIYCAFGSLFKGDDSHFIERLMAAVANQANWTVIMSMGKRRTDDYQDVPDNVHIFEWVSQLKVLKIADAIVMHAGIGTVMECLHYGVPMLSYPFAVNDQFGTAARIAYHQIGIVGDRENDNPDVIHQHIDQLLNDQIIRANMDAMQTALARYTPAHTITIFEALLNDA
ncbi:MAG: glycosyltransferase [Phototrophicaceae bacterium]